MSRRGEQLSDAVATVAGTLRRVGAALLEPLTTDPDVDMRLSIPEAQTTTIDGDVGWGDRPPAVLECPNCGADVYQHRPDSSIDCPECYVELDSGRFPDLELLYFRCPVCHDRMEHGRRHPEQFDVPEYAGCDNCRYHWEFEHF